MSGRSSASPSATPSPRSPTAAAVRPRDRPAAGSGRLPGPDHRPRAGPAPRRRGRRDDRAALRRVHHRDRLLQRVHLPPGGPRRHRRLRPRPVRHRPHRPHDPAAAAARRVDRRTCPTARAMCPAWARSPVWTGCATTTAAPWRPSPTPRAPGSSSSPPPAVRAARGRPAPTPSCSQLGMSDAHLVVNGGMPHRIRATRSIRSPPRGRPVKHAALQACPPTCARSPAPRSVPAAVQHRHGRGRTARPLRGTRKTLGRHR
jgi:hypothetical protein